jgi:hypothetical protein
LAGSVEGTCSKEQTAKRHFNCWLIHGDDPRCTAMTLLYADAASLAEFARRYTINSRLINKARPIWADKEQRNQS